MLVVKAKISAAEPPVRFSIPVNEVVPSSVPALAPVRSQVFVWLGPVRLSLPPPPLSVRDVTAFRPTVKLVACACAANSLTVPLPTVKASLFAVPFSDHGVGAGPP